MATDIRSVTQATRRLTRRAWSTIVVGAMVAVAFGVVAAKLSGGHLTALNVVNPPSLPGGIVLFPLVLVPIALWRWPQAGLVTLLVGTTLIEQFEYTIGPTSRFGVSYKGVFTEHIPLFRSLSKGSFVTPTEMLLFVLLLIWLMKGALDHTWHVPHSPLAKAIAAMYAIAIVVGMGLGVVHHGNMKVALWELRPWYYLGVMYLLTSSLFARRNVFRPLLWSIVIGSGLKSLQGVVAYVTVAHKMSPRPEAILGHEEAFFFGMFLLATVSLWLFQIRGRLRTVATALVPLVLVANLGNSRRTAFLLLYAGLGALLVIAYVGMPDRRVVLKWINVGLAMGAIAYLGLFWNNAGTLGQPARAVHSAIAPTQRDLASNQYRFIENANLIHDIHATRSIGQGFGIPINYAYTIVDLTNVDSAIAFIPHNNVLYVWYRLGIVGEIILWSIVGCGILAGCRLAKQGDRETAALGAIAVCAIICYVLEGYNDLGFTWLRIVVFMGFMLGALEATYQRVVNPRRALATPVEGEPVSAGRPDTSRRHRES
jgi:hypothetical protein